MSSKKLSFDLSIELTRIEAGSNEPPYPTKFVESLPDSFLLPKVYGVELSEAEVWLYALENDQMWSPPFGKVFMIEDITKESIPVVLRFLQDHAAYLAALWVKSTTDPTAAAEYLGEPTAWVKETALYTALQREYARKLIQD